MPEKPDYDHARRLRTGNFGIFDSMLDLRQARSSIFGYADYRSWAMSRPWPPARTGSRYSTTPGTTLSLELADRG
jgi:hypothetical protein